MKVSVLIPSDEYRNYAGCRIRYGRLQPALKEMGVQLELEDISSFAPQSSDCDALIISKCHDARAAIAAAVLSTRGRLVGIDVFDDYFSRRSDIRLSRFRHWLDQLLDHCQFVLCSTPTIKHVVRNYRETLPVHLVNDPEDVGSDRAIAQTLAEKLREARASRTIKLAWFGVGDNPLFKVGLSDLVAFSTDLTDLGREGMSVELTVLTNERALSVEGLALIEQIPVRTAVEEWSEARERRVLGDAFACFLPVNASSFSVAKSLNRAVTALGAGCQVISTGFPLYKPLGELVYDDCISFRSDLARGSMRHSLESIGRFSERIGALASASREAERLAAFLRGMTAPQQHAAPSLALVHGQASNGLAHKLVHASKGLSIASPYSAARLGFDVVFRGVAGRLTMLVSEKAAKKLIPERMAQLGNSVTIADRTFRELVGDGSVPSSIGAVSVDWEQAPLPVHIATYASTMDQIEARVRAAFGQVELIWSEESRLPFERSSERQR